MKAYVIMQKGFEYDDSIYNPSDGGSPKVIFFDKKHADEKSKEMETDYMKSDDICNYSYSVGEVINVDESELKLFVNELNMKYGIPDPKNKWNKFGDYQLNPKANKEESEKYLSMVNLRFFTVEEVEVDSQSLRDHQIKQILS